MNRLATIFLLFACSALAQPFTERDIAFLGRRDTTTDWAQRVVSNGGAMPSQNTINAMETLRLGCIAAGLTNKIYSLCVFVPDSLVAATTPLFLHKGYPLWTNSNFVGVGTDLDINGLKGNGTSKSLDTGCKARLIADGGISDVDGSRGLTVIVTESIGNSAGVPIGYVDADDVIALELDVSLAGSTGWFPTSLNPLYYLTTNDFGRVGYVSGNTWNDANTNVSIYVASPLESHKVIMTKTAPTSQPATSTDNTITVFAQKHGSTNRLWSAQRLSMAMVNDGFTSAESAAFWPLARACRETLGGGTGDPVHDWSVKVTTFGGAEVSTTTSNALRTFLSGLDTDATLYQIVAANAFVPDNLTAARVPIIWQGGNIIWSNVAFGTTNLTVNGLTGNATDKYLQTGLTNNLVATRGFGTTSAGISLLMYANPDTAGNGLLAVQGSGSQQFSLFSFAGTALFRCWLSSLVNQNFVTASVGTTTNGWLSGQRTAANAIALYKARSDTAHTVVTNATGSQTGAVFANHAQYIFAMNNAGPASAFSAPTISFAAITSGQSQTGNSNLWNRARNLRNDLGGGVP